jgi:Skp family chaperone for outer membrane proteins
MYTLQLEKISKKFSLFSFFFFIIFIYNSSKADVKFSVINIQKVTETCTVFNDIRKQIEDKSKSLSIRFDDKIRKIQENENNLKKKKDVLGKEALESEIKKIENDKKDIQNESQEESKKLQKVYFDTISTMNKKMSSIIETYSKEKKINAIFEASGLIYNNLDNITDDIIELMNKELPNFKINFD